MREHEIQEKHSCLRFHISFQRRAGGLFRGLTRPNWFALGTRTHCPALVVFLQ